MKPPPAFFDTNVLLYLLSADDRRADRAEALVAGGGVVSVQVLNEFASVARRKLGMGWAEIREALDPVRELCPVRPLTLSTHERGLALAERYRFSFYDALIVAAALEAGCATLYSEDMQPGLVVERQLTLCNPFTP